MATVSDSSILSAAQEIVTEFMDKKVSLNEGVIKKASALGFNDSQTQRLIERTNTEAFLRIYPNDTEFEVASPEVVLGIKTASITPVVNAPVADEGLFKAASVNRDVTAGKDFNSMPGRYATKVASVSDEDIFGMDEAFFKEAKETAYAPAIDPQNMDFCRAICESTKTASQKEQLRLAREEAFDDAIDALGEHIKQASLSGTQSIANAEGELYNMFPDASGFISNVFDAVVTKMASEGCDPRLLERCPAGAIHMNKVASASDLTQKFQRVLDVVRG